MTTIDIHLGGQEVTIDLDRLSPTARDLAHAIAASPGRQPVDIWVEADQSIRDTIPNWELFYTETEAAKPERRPWRGWSTTPLHNPPDDYDPHDRLEREARKIPAGWHVRLPAEAPLERVLTFLAALGRDIGAATWRAYVNRGQAPAPVHHIGRTPVWDLADVETWAKPRVGRCAYLGCTRDYKLVVGGLPFCTVEHVPVELRGLVAP